MVVNWEIVLANGSVVNANANENSDLWKAQKGGSGNLGFVTRIDQRKHLSSIFFHCFVLIMFFIFKHSYSRLMMKPQRRSRAPSYGVASPATI